jgi:anti-sigma regulatory factor (Ser/Thr protein kinase)
VRTLLGPGVDEDTVAAVLLAVSELTTNAVLHARTPFEVRAGVAGGVLRVEIDDDEPAVPRRRRPALLDVGGRGLLIVDDAVDAWGVDPRPAGKTVWFERTVSRRLAHAGC